VEDNDVIPREVLDHLNEQATQRALSAGVMVQNFGDQKPRLAPGKVAEYDKIRSALFGVAGYDPGTLRRKASPQALTIPGPFNVHAPSPGVSMPNHGAVNRQQLNSALLNLGDPPYEGAPDAPSPAEPAIPPTVIPSAPQAAPTVPYQDPKITWGLLGYGTENVPSAAEWNASQDASLAANPPPAPVDATEEDSFKRFSGLDPAPQFVAGLLSRDPGVRASVLRKMPPGERLSAINALRQIDIKRKSVAR
jgi:hypothetical protein